MRLCIDCTHYRCNKPQHVAGDYDRQCNIGPQLIDPVTGAVRLRFCCVERSPMGDCGPEGNLFGEQDRVGAGALA